jgi:hypothetical protein
MMNETREKERPARKWLDGVRDWPNEYLQTLSQMAQDRTKWREIVNRACDTNWH